MTDVNLEEHFLEEFSEWDKIERGAMYPIKRTHIEKFNEHMSEVLDSFPIESMVAEVSEAAAIKKVRATRSRYFACFSQSAKKDRGTKKRSTTFEGKS